MFVVILSMTFIAMEGVAWLMHAYLMHGPLWFLHQDHHQPTGSQWQKNDLFILAFAVPSYLMIHFGAYELAAMGYGILIYGVVYGIVHEVIIHRRFPWFRIRSLYLKGLILAHHDHHKVKVRLGAYNFGMLLVPLKYFKTSLQR